MSSALSINGSELLPIKEVVGRTPYSRDYLAKLAREGSVVAAQVGRQWYIDEASLRRFIETSELEATIRNRHLSKERRREREVVSVTKRHSDIIAAEPRFASQRALVRTIAIMCAGVFTGYLLYQVPGSAFSTALLQKALVPAQQAPLVKELAVRPVVEPTEFMSATEEAVVFSEENTTRAFASEQGVLLMPVGVSATTTTEIAALFSDPVTVAYSAPGVGTVTLAGGATATSVPFVTVPVLTAEVTPSERSSN